MKTTARITSKRRRPARWARPILECLECRTLLAGHTLATAEVLSFGPQSTAQTGGFLSGHQTDLYRLHLNTGDWLSVATLAQSAGSGLQALLRVLGDTGEQL